MQLYEVETLIENLWRKNKESWEQTRTVGYITAQCQSTKKIDPQEMMPFPWESDSQSEEITDDERKDILKEMKDMENKLNKK